jgi:CIC family chloride channel protein
MRSRILIFDSVMLGVIGALSARVFTFLLGLVNKLLLLQLAGYHPPGLPHEGDILKEIVGLHGHWFIPLVTTLGGLISGIIVYSLAPEAEGHGTDSVVKAFHRAGGFIRARVAPVKMIASVITIGSGGAAGREGPTALISAGFASVYATYTRRTESERRLLLLIGMAAGLSAIFRSPIGTAIFAIEVLYRDMEFEAGALFYVMLGSVVAYVINGIFVGWQPLFSVPSNIGLHSAKDYLFFVILGILSGVIATLLPVVFYRTRDLFHDLNVPPHIKPAIGGFGLGIIAFFLPEVLGGGYGWIQEAINGSLTLKVLIALVFAKIIGMSLTVSSGGSGGVFAPSLFVGAMLGGVLATVLHHPPAALVIVGMAAVFAGAARVPIATMLMVSEMTGGYHLLAAAALSVMVSYLIQVTLSQRLKYKSLYEAQVPTRADSPAHHVEHIQAALRLLNERKITLPSSVRHLDLYSILASGIPLDLPDGRQMYIGVLRKKSPWVGKVFESSHIGEDESHIDIAAIMREGALVFPNSETILEPGEQLVIVAKPEAWAKLKDNIAPLTGFSAKN